MKAITLVSVVIGLAASSQATACLCFEQPVAAAYAEAKAVFVGTVVGDEYVWTSFRNSVREYHLHSLSVIHTWKESETKRVPVVGGVSLPVKGFSGNASGIVGGLGLDLLFGARMSLFLQARITANLQDVPLNSSVLGALSGVQVLL